MSSVRLDTQSARSISSPTPVVIVSKSGESILERITLVRYAGHYRSDSIEAFVVRDHNGKVRVRSDNDLGLTEASEKIAYVADSYKGNTAVA